MKICAGIIGSGIGIKHFDAIQNYKKSFVKFICEKDKKKHLILKKSSKIQKSFQMKMKFLRIKI